VNDSNPKETILITGAAGMIGSQTAQGLLEAGKRVVGLDRRESASPVSEKPELCANYKHYVVDLGCREDLDRIFEQEPEIKRVVHLAALAHTTGEKDLSFERYYQVNVQCAVNIFEAAAKRKIPTLFISTADVYGFVKGVATAETKPCPITPYGVTKALAEEKLREIFGANGVPYEIFRFAPVYTETIKRDIQKRYYLKYPNVAYLVGKGTDYEVLSIENAVKVMVEWTNRTPLNGIRNVKNEEYLNTVECVEQEKALGRAKVVLRFPRWLICCGFAFLLMFLGKNSKTYLLNKVVSPLRTE